MKFKIGDKVKYLGGNLNFEMALRCDKIEEFTVESIDERGIYFKELHGWGRFNTKYFELETGMITKKVEGLEFIYNDKIVSINDGEDIIEIPFEKLDNLIKQLREINDKI